MARTREGDGTREPIVQLDDDVLDEFVLSECSVHFEAMDDNQWWIGIVKGDRMWHINLGATNPRAKAYAHVWGESPDGPLYYPEAVRQSVPQCATDRSRHEGTSE